MEGQGTSECRVAEIRIFEEDQNTVRYGSPLFRMICPVGTVNYEGRVNQH